MYSLLVCVTGTGALRYVFSCIHPSIVVPPTWDQNQVYSPRVLLLSGTGLEELFREHFSLTLGWVGRIERPGCKAQGMCGQHREPGVGLDRAAGARFASLSYPVMPGTAACKPIRWKAESRIGDSRVKAPNRPQLCQEGSDSGTDVLLRAGRLGFKLHTWQSR